MSTFLAELGTRLADRWLQALLLPGLLWAITVTAALELGQHHALDLARLGTSLDRIAGRPAAHAPGTVIIAAGGILLASSAVGLAAGFGGALIQHLWASPGDVPPASWLLSRRRRRWDHAAEAVKAAIRDAVRLSAPGDPLLPATQDAEVPRVQTRIRILQRRLDRMGPVRPTSPTRTGDRFARTGIRIASINGLTDLAMVWPRLWSILPETLRTDITAARTAYSATARQTAWAFLYFALTPLWWPAAPIGVTVFVAAGVQARAAANVLAHLIETAADLYTLDLAEHLGVPAASTLADTGHSIMSRLSTTTP